MTRAIFGRSSSSLASFSIIEATISISYGVRPRIAALVSRSSWPATRSISVTIRSTTWASLSAFDTWYVSGNSSPSSDVTPGGR